MRKVILLDLNKTLAKKCKWYGTTYYPQQDVYSQELTDVLNSEKFADWEIHIVTARLASYKEETLKKIEREVGLRIDKVAFKSDKNARYPVHYFKADYARQLREDSEEEIVFKAIESNSNTKAEYRNIGITDCQTREEFLIAQEYDNQLSLWEKLT
jgi:signal peptidase I